MSLSSHLAELRKKHASLEIRIEKECRSPGSEDLQIAELKRERLRLKDEITRIAGGPSIH